MKKGINLRSLGIWRKSCDDFKRTTETKLNAYKGYSETVSNKVRRVNHLWLRTYKDPQCSYMVLQYISATRDPATVSSGHLHWQKEGHYDRTTG